MDWQPIETFFEQNEPHALFDSEPIYFDSALVYACQWEAGNSPWFDSPHEPKGGKWGDKFSFYIASTWLGSPCWKADDQHPDYEIYLKPTHWMPLVPPADDHIDLPRLTMGEG